MSLFAIPRIRLVANYALGPLVALSLIASPIAQAQSVESWPTANPKFLDQVSGMPDVPLNAEGSGIQLEIPRALITDGKYSRGSYQGDVEFLQKTRNAVTDEIITKRVKLLGQNIQYTQWTNPTTVWTDANGVTKHGRTFYEVRYLFPRTRRGVRVADQLASDPKPLDLARLDLRANAGEVFAHIGRYKTHAVVPEARRSDDSDRTAGDTAGGGGGGSSSGSGSTDTEKGLTVAQGAAIGAAVVGTLVVGGLAVKAYGKRAARIAAEETQHRLEEEAKRDARNVAKGQKLAEARQAEARRIREEAEAKYRNARTTPPNSLKGESLEIDLTGAGIPGKSGKTAAAGAMSKEWADEHHYPVKTLGDGRQYTVIIRQQNGMTYSDYFLIRALTPGYGWYAPPGSYYYGYLGPWDPFYCGFAYGPGGDVIINENYNFTEIENGSHNYVSENATFGNAAASNNGTYTNLASTTNGAIDPKEAARFGNNGGNAFGNGTYRNGSANVASTFDTSSSNNGARANSRANNGGGRFDQTTRGFGNNGASRGNGGSHYAENTENTYTSRENSGSRGNSESRENTENTENSESSESSGSSESNSIVGAVGLGGGAAAGAAATKKAKPTPTKEVIAADDPSPSAGPGM